MPFTLILVYVYYRKICIWEVISKVWICNCSGNYNYQHFHGSHPVKHCPKSIRFNNLILTKYNDEGNAIFLATHEKTNTEGLGKLQNIIQLERGGINIWTQKWDLKPVLNYNPIQIKQQPGCCLTRHQCDGTVLTFNNNMNREVMKILCIINTWENVFSFLACKLMDTALISFKI